MMKKIQIATAALALLAAPVAASAQQQSLTPEEQEKKTYEYIDNKVEDYINTLNLNGAQIFWVDSILTHNTFSMMEEMMKLQKAKMSIADAYSMTQDKWNEATYQAFRKILNDEQWAKYLKTGGAKEKKARDKRNEKRSK